MQARRVGTHIISAWPDNALKVVAQTQVEGNKWTHVTVTYDASGQRLTMTKPTGGTYSYAYYADTSSCSSATGTRTSTPVSGAAGSTNGRPRPIEGASKAYPAAMSAAKSGTAKAYIGRWTGIRGRAGRTEWRPPRSQGSGMPTIYVTGHRNPDLDSIASAIGYAELKQRLNPHDRYIPARIGDVTAVDIGEDTEAALTLLFDPGHALDERILREQFNV